MTIQLSNAGKRYNRDWIFRNASLTFLPHHTYAITGSNGTGKSTLLQAIAGSLAISEGQVSWQIKGSEIDSNLVYNHLSIAAPYVEVIEEMTAFEFLEFHQKFKPLIASVSIKEMLSLLGLEKAANKQIRYYSSGMKQRIKLAQAIFSDVPLMLLDEPCTNLDTAGFELYNTLINKYGHNKTIIVSSNDINEYSFCENVINIMDYK
ncbi:MAG TPA: ATP-binding cassette domain-containing protein [Segetibacter sp.]|nr:ATP-binding cassette domain-containing protein [Segetibacter sp.]